MASGSRQSKGKGIAPQGSQPSSAPSPIPTGAGPAQPRWSPSERYSQAHQNPMFESPPEIEQILGSGINYDPMAMGDEPNPFSHTDSAQQQPTMESEPVDTTTTGSQSRSDIFRLHFTKVYNNDGEITHARCNYCTTQYKFRIGGGYGTMIRHLTGKHPDKVGHNQTQTQIRFASEQGSSQATGLFSFSQSRYRELMAETIAVEHLPFNFAERCKLNECINQALQPAAKKISRRTIQRTIYKQYKTGKRNLCEYFMSTNSSISLCSDIWTDCYFENSYMGVTAHWVDEEWKIQKRVIGFREFNDSHNAQNIHRLMSNIIEEYNLNTKIFSVSFDNAAANTASIRTLEQFLKPMCGGKFFHIRCACHVLNLCVQSGLESLKFFLGPIRDVIAYMRSRNSLMKQWTRYCRAHNMRAKRFPKDIKTRWNSTYRLLNETWPYKELLTSFVNEYINEFHLLQSNWEVANRIMNLLAVFNTSTNLMSQVYFPTAHLFLYIAIDVAEQFYKFRNDEELVQGLSVMKDKWLAYYENIPPIALVAFILDPRQKIDGLEMYLGAYYNFLGYRTTGQVVSELDSHWYSRDNIEISEIVRETRKQLVDVYENYCAKYSHLVTQVRGEASGGVRGEEQGGDIDSFRQRAARMKKPRGSLYTEVDLYLNTNFWFNSEQNADMNFDVLEWWRTNGNPYPVLSYVVRDILACPMSTVACEQTFSASGNMLDPTRSQLTSQNVEIIVCADDWSRAKSRQQEAETGSPEASDFFHTDTTGESSMSTVTEPASDPDAD